MDKKQRRRDIKLLITWIIVMIMVLLFSEPGSFLFLYTIAWAVMSIVTFTLCYLDDKPDSRIALTKTAVFSLIFFMGAPGAIIYRSSIGYDAGDRNNIMLAALICGIAQFFAFGKMAVNL